MVQESKIEWCTHTSNPLKYRSADGKVVWACIKKSSGCANCYAETLAQRYGRGGPFTKPVMAGLTPFVDEKELRELLSPRKLPAGSKCFVGDMTDVFGEWVTDAMLDRLFAAFALRPDVVFQVLTKRPQRMQEYLTARRYHHESLGLVPTWEWIVMAVSLLRPSASATTAADFHIRRNWPLPNVWLGTSVENQDAADERLAWLVNTPAALRFISAEPLIGEVDLLAGMHADRVLAMEFNPDARFNFEGFVRSGRKPALDWAIVGGESGPGARPMDLAWMRSVVKQCLTAGVPVFVKQLGSKPYEVQAVAAGRVYPSGRAAMNYVAEPVAHPLKDRKGRAMEEWPEDLRVRQWPAAEVAVG